jgi:hypothetical protein
MSTIRSDAFAELIVAGRAAFDAAKAAQWGVVTTILARRCGGLALRDWPQMLLPVLCVAAEQGHEAGFSVVLACGLRIVTVDGSLDNSLAAALGSGGSTTLIGRLLGDTHFNPDANQAPLWKLVAAAAGAKHWEAVDMVLQRCRKLTVAPSETRERARTWDDALVGIAVRRGDFDRAMWLVRSHGADPNLVLRPPAALAGSGKARGPTVLAAAVIDALEPRAASELVQELAGRHGACLVTWADPELCMLPPCETPLGVAVRRNALPVVEFIASLVKLPVHLWDKSPWSALNSAAEADGRVFNLLSESIRCQAWEVARWLVGVRRVSLDFTTLAASRACRDAVECAARWDATGDFLRFLLAERGEEVNLGISPVRPSNCLMWAARSNMVHNVRFLALHCGVPVNVAPGRLSPLHACLLETPSDAVARVLLTELGADANAACSSLDGMLPETTRLSSLFHVAGQLTVLGLACARLAGDCAGQRATLLRIVRLLLAAGADPDLLPRAGCFTAMEVALHCGSPDALRCILSHGFSLPRDCNRLHKLIVASLPSNAVGRRQRKLVLATAMREGICAGVWRKRRHVMCAVFRRRKAVLAPRAAIEPAEPHPREHVLAVAESATL